MLLYTIYLLKDDASIQEVRSVLCEGDDDAIDHVGDIDHPYSIDLRQGDRHVARFPPWPRR